MQERIQVGTLAQAHTVFAHIVQSWIALGDHQEGTDEENNERQLNYLNRGFGSSRDTRSVLCVSLKSQNKVYFLNES